MIFLETIKQSVENNALIYLITNLGSVASFVVMLVFAIQLIRAKIKGTSNIDKEAKNNAIALVVSIVIMLLCVLIVFFDKGTGATVNADLGSNLKGEHIDVIETLNLICTSFILITSFFHTIYYIFLHNKSKRLSYKNSKKLGPIITVLTSLIAIITLFTLNIYLVEKNEANPMDICILLGDISNAKQADLSVLDKYIDSDDTYIRSIKICVLDGDPANNTYEHKPYFDRNKQSGLYVYEIQGALNKEYYPKTAETDILAGLWEAEKYLFNDVTGSKKLVIFSSGISTKGYINFRESLINLNETETTYFVNALKDKNYLPNLNGVDVEWYNLGETEEPQMSLDRATRKKIEGLWTEILNECGVKVSNNFFKYSLLSENYNSSTNKSNYEKYPYVTPIVFEETEKVWSFTEISLQFTADKSTFLNQEKAIATLKPYAYSMGKTTSNKYIIVGSTAGDGPEEMCLKLSLNRANAVKSILCEYGVPEESIITYGIGNKTVGSENLTGREIDEKDGKIIEHKAKLNRKVMIVDLSTELGRKILAELEKMSVLKG